MLRICYVAEFGKNVSGSEHSLLNIIDEMSQKDVELFVVSHKNGLLFDELKKRKIKTCIIKGAKPTEPIGNNSIKLRLIKIVKRVYIYWNIPRAIFYLKKNKIDIVHANTTFVSPSVLYAAKILRIPYIWHIREFLDKDHGFQFITKKENVNLISKSSVIIAISNSIKQTWQEILKKNCVLVYNGIPTEQSYILRSNLFGEGKLRILVSGRIVEKKGQLDVVKAVNHLINNGFDDVELNLVGFSNSSEYEKKIISYIHEHKLNRYIKTYPYASDIELCEYRKKCNIGIMSSASEAFGRVTVEYMVSGMLVIGTDSGGTPEIIHNMKTGLLYQYGDVEGLALILKSIISNVEYMENIAREGQKRALNQFSIKNTANSIFAIYKNCKK